MDLQINHHIASDEESGAVLHDGTNNGTNARKRGPYALFVPMTAGRWHCREFRAMNDDAAVERANALLPATLRAAKRKERADAR